VHVGRPVLGRALFGAAVLVVVALGGSALVPTHLTGAEAAIAAPAQRSAALPAPAATARATAVSVTRRTVRVQVGGRARAYVVVAPSRLANPAPLVVVFPGWHQSVARAERIQGWDRRVRADGLVVAYASSFDGSWNAGTCCRPASRVGVDDVAYLDRVLRDVEARYPINARRVYLVGFSNGGMMAYRYACARSGAVAAVAVVAGTLAYPGCTPSRPVAVLDIQGGRDRVVPLAGTAFSRVLQTSTLSVRLAVAVWRRVDAGSGRWVDLVVLPALRHRWPGSGPGGYDATDRIWAFLRTQTAAG
jgi:polyhydroxybutyrate depolymerase